MTRNHVRIWTPVSVNYTETPWIIKEKRGEFNTYSNFQSGESDVIIYVNSIWTLLESAPPLKCLVRLPVHVNQTKLFHLLFTLGLRYIKAGVCNFWKSSMRLRWQQLHSPPFFCSTTPPCPFRHEGLSWFWLALPCMQLLITHCTGFSTSMKTRTAITF